MEGRLFGNSRTSRPRLGLGDESGRRSNITSRRSSSGSTRTTTPDTWTDVHNVVIQMLIAVGVVGVVLLTVFVVLAIRRVDSRMASGRGGDQHQLVAPTGWHLSLACRGDLPRRIGAACRCRTEETNPRWPRVLTALGVALGLTAALAPRGRRPESAPGG